VKNNDLRHPTAFPRVLLVSRPLEPDRADGTVQLVRRLAAAGAALELEANAAPVAEAGGRGAAGQGNPAGLGNPAGPPAGSAGAGERAVGRWQVLLPAGAPPPAPGVPTWISAPAGSWGRYLWQPITLAWLLSTPTGWIRHYFFTPTLRVVRALRAMHALRPGPTVQTLCSTPADHVDLRPLVFADRVVALSRHTRDRLLATGVAPHRIRLIPPPSEPLPTGDPAAKESLRLRVRRRLGLPDDARILLYMGDYDVTGAALAVARALPALLRPHPARHAVLACRPKGAAHAEVARQVRAALAAGGSPAHRVHPVGVVERPEELAAGADLTLLPARRLPDKMDLPLALLQSLAGGVPAVVSDRGPLSDLVRAGAAAGVDPRAPQRIAWEAEQLLSDPAAHAAQGEAGRRWCATTGAPKRVARAHLQLYRELQE
jgi:glycosyltransferase involved in cell wall biosynthesis